MRHRLFSSINVLGLAIGLAAVTLIALYVRYENSYDSFWKNSDNIYRLHTTYNQPGIAPQNWATTPPLLKPALEKDFPLIDHSSRLIRVFPTINYQEDYYQEEVSLADPEILEIFEFDLVSGNLEAALNNPRNMTVSNSMAKRMFGNSDPIGKILTLTFSDFTNDYTVAAVIEDIPHNSMVDFDIMLPLVEAEWEDTEVFRYGWASFGGPTYFTLNEGENLDDLKDQLPEFIDRNYIAFREYEDLRTSDIISLIPLNIQNVHLQSGATYERRPIGDNLNIVIFSIISLSILFIASINYMNLSTARATQRAREVSVRKTVGASRLNLITQFLAESIFITMVSLVIAMCIVEVVLPLYNDLLGINITFNYSASEGVLLASVAVMVGILGGIYPAFVLSSFRPALVLKSNQSPVDANSLNIRTTLVVLQFAISICLFVSTAVVFSQINYVKTEELGFDQENLLIINAFRRDAVNSKAELLLTEIERLPTVTDVSTSNFMPAPRSSEVRSLWTDQNEGSNGVRINSSYVGYDYFKTYDIRLIEGREYERNRDFNMPSYDEIRLGNSNVISVVVNEAAVNHFGYGPVQDAIGKIIYQRGPMEGDLRLYREFEIIGVIPDVRIENMKKQVRPEVFFLDTNRTGAISIRFAGDPREVVKEINEIWTREVPTVELNYEFAEERMINEYIKELNELNMFTAFSGLAIFIACLGLFGLATFTTERRTKEIGVRKVFGAEVWQIVRMLVFQFSKPVLIANIIAWPIAYLTMSSWLESFVYRIDDMVIIALCLVAGLTALLIAWVTVAGNSYTVARQNPIEALRYE